MTWDIFFKNSMDPKSFDDTCPVSLELEDIIYNWNKTKKCLKNYI